MCEVCDIRNNSEEPPVNTFNEGDIEKVILGIYAGIITTRNLDYNTYIKTAKKLMEGVFKGYSKTIESVLYKGNDWYMLEALRKNIYIFSAAKTYQQTREVSALLPDNVGNFANFKKQAKSILFDYNENYLRTEYNSAIAQSYTASQWQQIIKDKEYLPMLTYHTAGDGRVRPAHEVLNNISRRVDDKFWDIYMPPNGWNCRCTVLQSSDATQTNLKGFKAPDDVPDIFKFNAGKEKIIFSPKHPYFKVDKKDVSFAKQNFDLHIP